MKEFILVISMWGSDGATDHYIGQMALQQPMSEKQCHWMIDNEQWSASFDNEYYFFARQCFPKECAGKKTCE